MRRRIALAPGFGALVSRVGRGTAFTPAIRILDLQRRFCSSSVAAAGVSGVSGGLAAPDDTSSSPSYLDYIDKFYEVVVPGGTALPGTTADSTAGIFAQIQLISGLDASLVLLFCGGMLRLVTLFFSIYGERAMSRMMAALSQLESAHRDYDILRSDPSTPPLQLHKAADALKAKRKKVFAAHQTSNLQCLAPLGAAPLLMWGYSGATAYTSGCMAIPFLWCSSIAFPDPIFVLPFLCCSATLVNFELSMSKQLREAPWMNRVLWTARLGAIAATPVLGTFQAGVCLFLLGMNLSGLFQPLLLRQEKFRALLGFPPSPTPSQEQQRSGVATSKSIQRVSMEDLEGIAERTS